MGVPGPRGTGELNGVGRRGEPWVLGKAGAQACCSAAHSANSGRQRGQPPSCGSRVCGVCPVVLPEGCLPQGAVCC